MAEAALALLSRTRHEGGRVFRHIDASLMNLMHELGWISEPVVTENFVTLTTKGQRKARRVLETRFSKGSGQTAKRSTPAVQPELAADRRDNCIVMRCTAKLLKELRIKPTEVPEGVPSSRDWHATLVPTARQKSVLISHSETLYTVVLLGVVQKRLARFGEEFASRAHVRLNADGFSEHSAVLPSGVPNLVFAKTNNRSVLGSMNDLAYQLQVRIGEIRDVRAAGEIEMSKELNRIPMVGTLDGAFAIDAMAKRLGAPAPPYEGLEHS